MSQATKHPLDPSAQRRALLNFCFERRVKPRAAVGAPLA